MKKMKNWHQFTISVLLTAFVFSSVQMPVFAQIDPMPWMPRPGLMVPLSPEFSPAFLKGIVIHPEDPLKFDFIIYKGDKALNEAQKRVEYTKLTKYFLASLAIPDDDQWVNLSPYEKDRIIKDDFGHTLMGRDLLAQDYLLKQITASMIYPEDNLGKIFWDRVYAQAQKQYGTTNVPVNTFNKVWILPDDALIYEKGKTAYILKNHLRVMLEEDYLSLQKHSGIESAPANKTHTIASRIVKEIVLPELQREVNEDANFAPLRQVYSGMLLATWFKRALKQSLLGQIYANKGKVRGVDQDPKTNEEIYRQYLKAYKKGVFNFIREDTDRLTNETIPRKYFSGGLVSEGMAFRNGVPITHDDAMGSRAMLGDETKDDMAQIALVNNAALRGRDRNQKKSVFRLTLGGAVVAMTLLLTGTGLNAQTISVNDLAKLPNTPLIVLRGHDHPDRVLENSIWDSLYNFDNLSIQEKSDLKHKLLDLLSSVEFGAIIENNNFDKQLIEDFLRSKNSRPKVVAVEAKPSRWYGRFNAQFVQVYQNANKALKVFGISDDIQSKLMFWFDPVLYLKNTSMPDLKVVPIESESIDDRDIQNRFDKAESEMNDFFLSRPANEQETMKRISDEIEARINHEQKPFSDSEIKDMAGVFKDPVVRREALRYLTALNKEVSEVMVPRNRHDAESLENLYKEGDQVLLLIGEAHPSGLTVFLPEKHVRIAPSYKPEVKPVVKEEFVDKAMLSGKDAAMAKQLSRGKAAALAAGLVVLTSYSVYAVGFNRAFTPELMAKEFVDVANHGYQYSLTVEASSEDGAAQQWGQIISDSLKLLKNSDALRVLHFYPSTDQVLGHMRFKIIGRNVRGHNIWEMQYSEKPVHHKPFVPGEDAAMKGEEKDKAMATANTSLEGNMAMLVAQATSTGIINQYGKVSEDAAMNTQKVREQISRFKEQLRGVKDIKEKIGLLLPHILVDGERFGENGKWMDLGQGIKGEKRISNMRNYESRLAWAMAWETRLELFNLIHDISVDEQEKSRRSALLMQMAQGEYDKYGSEGFNNYALESENIINGYWQEGIRRMSINELKIIGETMQVVGRSGYTNVALMGEYPLTQEGRLHFADSAKHGLAEKDGPMVIFRIPSILNEIGHYGSGLPYTGVEVLSQVYVDAFKEHTAQKEDTMRQWLENFNLFILDANKYLMVEDTRKLNAERVNLKRQAISRAAADQISQLLDVIVAKQRDAAQTHAYDQARKGFSNVVSGAVGFGDISVTSHGPFHPGDLQANPNDRRVTIIVERKDAAMNISRRTLIGGALGLVGLKTAITAAILPFKGESGKMVTLSNNGHFDPTLKTRIFLHGADENDIYQSFNGMAQKATEQGENFVVYSYDQNNSMDDLAKGFIEGVEAIKSKQLAFSKGIEYIPYSYGAVIFWRAVLKKPDLFKNVLVTQLAPTIAGAQGAWVFNSIAVQKGLIDLAWPIESSDRLRLTDALHPEGLVKELQKAELANKLLDIVGRSNVQTIRGKVDDEAIPTNSPLLGKVTEFSGVEHDKIAEYPQIIKAVFDRAMTNYYGGIDLNSARKVAVTGMKGIVERLRTAVKAKAKESTISQEENYLDGKTVSFVRVISSKHIERTTYEAKDDNGRSVIVKVFDDPSEIEKEREVLSDLKQYDGPTDYGVVGLRLKDGSVLKGLAMERIDAIDGGFLRVNAPKPNIIISQAHIDSLTKFAQKLRVNRELLRDMEFENFMFTKKGKVRPIDMPLIKSARITDDDLDMNQRYLFDSIISRVKAFADKATLSPGGIDLNSANLNLRIKRDGNGMPILSQQDLAQIGSSLEGLDPVILSIKSASQTALFAELVGRP
jgi:hypothetical protein